jgi:hypothetical protein
VNHGSDDGNLRETKKTAGFSQKNGRLFLHKYGLFIDEIYRFVD